MSLSARAGTSALAPALAYAAGCLAFVGAQYVWPAWPGFHTWQYAAALALAATPVARLALSARREPEGGWLSVALVGVLVVAMTGLAAGLLGPDTQVVSRAPGTVVPLPDLGVAAFFPSPDSAALARADEGVLLRRRGASDIDVAPGARHYVGATVVTVEQKIAAYVTARDLRGNHLTLTQPASAAFLSPVLLFAEQVTIAGRVLPADAFAAPAVHRQIKAFYFSRSDVAQQSHGVRDRASVLFAVDDENGRPIRGGIGFAASGEELVLGGLRLQPVLGHYPALVISAVPYPAAVWLGGLLFAGALAFGLVPRRRASETARAPLSAAKDVRFKTTSRPG